MHNIKHLKKIIIFSLFFITFAVNANSTNCPDLSGSWSGVCKATFDKSAEFSYDYNFEIEQFACERLLLKEKDIDGESVDEIIIGEIDKKSDKNEHGGFNFQNSTVSFWSENKLNWLISSTGVSKQSDSETVYTSSSGHGFYEIHEDLLIQEGLIEEWKNNKKDNTASLDKAIYRMSCTLKRNK